MEYLNILQEFKKIKQQEYYNNQQKNKQRREKKHRAKIKQLLKKHQEQQARAFPFGIDEVYQIKILHSKIKVQYWFKFYLTQYLSGFIEYNLIQQDNNKTIKY